MSIIQTLLTTQQQNDITNYVNMYRAKHQTIPMKWDANIATASQQWSYHLMNTGLFEHSNNVNYGENLAQLQGYGFDATILIKKSIDLWYNEITKYDFTKPDFSPSTGHFTCLIWAASTSFGIGLTIDLKRNIADIVMNTSPAGNVIGQFQQNVLPLVAPTPSVTTTPITNKEEIINELKKLIKELNMNKKKTQVIADIQNVINRLSSQ